MATDKAKQTVRERSQTAAKAPKRRLQQSAKTAATVRQGVKRVAKPLAKPFQNKPMRLLGKILLINYLVSSWRELKQVSWPGRKETTKLTLAVFVFAIIFGIIIFVVDYGLDKVFHKLFVS